MFHAAGYQHELALRVLDRARSPLARLRDELASCLRTVAESSRWWSCAREEPHRLLVALATTTDDAGEIAGRIEDYAGGARTSNLVAEWLAGMKRGEEAGAARALLGRRATASLVDRLAAHAPLRALVERPDGS